MLKLKNKFIFIVIVCIVGILGIELGMSYFYNKVDTNSYALLVQGEAMHNGDAMEVGIRDKILVGDTLETGEKSLLAIEWGDGSITRLGDNSSLQIENNDIKKDLSTINIRVRLISGRLWSSVVSMIGEGSSFDVSFNDIEAGVRGTTFDIDLVANTLFVSHHEVTLQKESGESYVIGENSPFSLKTFTFIDLQEFILKLRNKAWEDVNKKLDKENIERLKNRAIKYFGSNKLTLNLLEIFIPKYRVLSELHFGDDFSVIQSSISRLSKREKEKLYTQLYEEYQKINFSDVSGELYTRKDLYKNTLMLLESSEKQKELFVKATLYDMQDIIKSGNFELLEAPIAFLEKNREFIADKRQKINQIFSGESLPANISEKLGNAYGVFNDIFNEGIQGDTLKQSIEGVNNNAKEMLNKGLNSIYNIFNK